MDGFDLNSPLVCEGIVGDGCGGGRIFFIQEDTLFAYDPTSNAKMELLRDVKGAKSITKNACIITIELEDKTTQFDLSALKVLS